MNFFSMSKQTVKYRLLTFLSKKKNDDPNVAFIFKNHSNNRMEFTVNLPMEITFEMKITRVNKPKKKKK